MFATTANGEVHERRHGHEGHLTYDVFPWRSGEDLGNVRFHSRLHVFILEPDKGPGKRHADGRWEPEPYGPCRVGLWVPGGEQGNPVHTLAWGGEQLWRDVEDWGAGVASVVSFDDVPLYVRWDFIPYDRPLDK